MNGAQGGREAAPATWLAAACAAALALALLVLAGGPLGTNDMWWHLAHGASYAREGPRLSADPCLFTAAGPPAPHDWLFALGLHGLERAAGLQALRVLHVAALAAILALAWSLLRRAGGSAAAACAGLAAWIAVAWYRLVQLRPELATIAVVLLLYRLLLEGEAPPPWRRVALAALLVAVCANLHALFLVGPLLVGAAALGLAARAALGRARAAGEEARAAARSDALRAARLALATALCLVAALANPRGIGQHFAFAAASRSGAIWTVADEWEPFHPFTWSNHPLAVSAVAWVLLDALLLALALSAALAAARALRRVPAALARVDAVGLAVGLASALAILVSIRFAWMAAFPLLHLLREARPALRRRGAAPALAAATAALAAAALLWGGLRPLAARLPSGPRAYLATSADTSRFFGEAVRFLDQVGVRGNLFQPYGMGGYLCQRLAPRLRTFVDGSMNFPADVWEDYENVVRQRGTRPHETDADVLERRGVDLFLGTGVPAGDSQGDSDAIYTTTQLEGVSGWILVSRSFRHALYLRADARNRDNLGRIEDFYRHEGVPFDPARGLDPGAVVRARPDWAAAHELLPPGWPQLLTARNSPEPGVRAAALEKIGLSHALAGAYADELAVEREAEALRPRAPAPLRRHAWALLHLGRFGAAADVAERLLALDPLDPRSRAFAATARALRDGAPPLPEGRTARTALAALPLLSSRSPLRQ